MNALTLLNTLEGLGVSVTVRPGGKLRLEPASLVPAELLTQIRDAKPALLEALRGVPSAPDLGAARSSFAELDALAGTPGHCGMCARWEALAAPLAHLGECSAGRRAHGWQDGNPAAAVEIHAAHSCAAWEGKGFRARVSGRRSGPRPPAEPGVSL